MNDVKDFCIFVLCTRLGSIINNMRSVAVGGVSSRYVIDKVLF